MARSLRDWIGDSDSSQNNQSVLARFGAFGQQYTDPLYWIFGDKYTDKLIGLADKSNRFLSKVAKQDPVVQFDRRNNPLQDTPEGKKVGDFAENKPLDSIATVLGAIYGGGALAGGLGGGSGAAGGGLGSGAAAPAGMTTAGFMPGSAATAGMEGVTVLGSSGAAMSPGTAAAMAAAGASAAPAQSQGFDWQKAIENMPQSGGQQQQQQMGSPPQRPQQRGGIVERIKRGLGQTGERMFPIDQAYGMTPEQQRTARKQALLQMGLGMMAASGQGAGFGEAAAFGLGRAQNNLNGALQAGYENARANRMEQRQMERDQIADERFSTEMDYRKAQAESVREDRALQFEQRKAEQEALSTYRDQQIELQKQQMEQQRAMQEQQLKLREMQINAQMATAGLKAGTLPEGTQKTLSYLTRMQNAEANLAANGYTPQGLSGAGNVAASMVPGVGNFLTSGNFQKYQSSAREWIAGVLRYDSGAAVPETEFRRYFNTWFAQPGDSAETIAQKEQMREMARHSLEIGLPRSAIERMNKPVSNGATRGWTIEQL